MNAMQAELAAADEQRQDISKATRAIVCMVARMQFSLSVGAFDEVDAALGETDAAVRGVLSLLDGDDSGVREGGALGNAVESVAEIRLIRLFFRSGRLAPLAAVQPCSDDEYVSASLGVAQHLARYCVGRACEADARSVAICRAAVAELMAKMLEFDFRNGPLRRKFDGLLLASQLRWPTDDHGGTGSTA